MTHDTAIESRGTLHKKEGTRWRVVVATPGQGASGFYSEDVLREYGPAAIPPGTKAFFDHDPKRSLKDLVGTYPDGAFWNDESKQLEADLQPFTHWQSVVDELGPHAEASIHIKASFDSNHNVIALHPHRANTVDLVGFAGLEGSGLKFQMESLVNSAREADEAYNNGADSSALDERKRMDHEKLVIEFNELKALVTSFVEESRKAAEGKDDEPTVETVVAESLSSVKDSLEAIAAVEGLLPAQVKDLNARAFAGEDVTAALETAKAVAAEAADLSTKPGALFVKTGDEVARESLDVNSWKNRG